MISKFAIKILKTNIEADPSKIDEICKIPKNVDQYLWQYEHIRQFITQLNLLIVHLQDSDACHQEKCPKMKATDMWLYRCASHKQPQDCSAIDYMLHLLDHSTSTLLDPKNFKSRFEILKS